MLSYARFVAKAGLLFASLLLAVPHAGAQFVPQALGTISCVLTAVPPLQRAEALADMAGQVRLDCTNNGALLDTPPPHDVQTYVLANFNLVMNTNVTNRIDFSSGATVIDAVLVVGSNEPATPTVISTLGGPDPKFPVPQLPELTSPFTMAWNGVQFPVPGAPLNTVSPPALCGPGTCIPPVVTFVMKNVRVDAAAFGIPLAPAVLTSPVIGAVGILSFVSIILSTNIVTIGLPLRGVTSSPSPGAGPGDIDVDIAEGFATAFKPLGVFDINMPGQMAERGYGVPGSLDAT